MVSTENTKEVLQAGFDITGYNRIVTYDEIRHEFKSHGNVAKEKARGQRAITQDDFKVLTEIVNNPDKVVNQGKKFQNLPTFKYVRRFGNEEWHYVEAVNKKQKTVLFGSFWIKE